MNKTTVLVNALRKSGRSLSAVAKAGNNKQEGKKGKKSNASLDQSGNTLPLILGMLGAALAWALTVGPLEGYMTCTAAIETVCTCLTTLIVMLSLMKMLTGMYLGDDLQVLLTLPFTENEIAMAKVRIIAEQRYMETACFVVPFMAMWAYFGTVTVNEVLASALMVLLLPALAMSITGIVVMVVMRAVRLVRNKNALRVGGSVIGLLFSSVVYYFVILKPDGGDSGVAATMAKVVRMSETMRKWFPATGLVSDIAATGKPVAVAILAGATVLSVALFLIAVKALYFKAALSMIEASNARRVLKGDELRKLMASHAPVKSIIRRDRRMILRTASFLTNGVVAPLVTCILMCLVIISGPVDMMGTMLRGRSFGPTLTFGLSGTVAALAFAGLTPPASAFSREGASFSATNALPIPPETLLRAKRDLAMHFGIATNTLPVTLCLIGVCASGKLLPIALPFGLIFNLALLFITAEVLILCDLKRPNFNWENPGDIHKKDVTPLVIMLIVAALIAGAIALTYLWRTKGGFGYAAYVVYGGIALLSVVAAAVLNRFYYKKGAELLARL